MFDLGPAATQMTRLVQGVPDDRLGGPTPCPAWTVIDLLDHVHGFTQAFIGNARKEDLPADAAREVDGRRLTADWRTVLPTRLDELAAAWREESAWQGRVSAGGIAMSAEESAIVGLEELVVHGWDLARATGQEFHADDAVLDGVQRFLEAFAEPIASGQGPYGPAVRLPADASRLDRVIGATGRDPAWAPPR